jgi:hypothetical protein
MKEIINFVIGIIFFITYLYFLDYFGDSIITFKYKSWKYWVGLIFMAVFFWFYKNFIN